MSNMRFHDVVSVVRRWFATRRKIKISLCVAGVLAVIAILALSWALPTFELPRPTGPFAVGTAEFHFIDTAREEMHTASPLDRRELMVRVWYPATVGANEPAAPYWPDAKVVARAINQQHWPYGYLLRHLDQVPAHSYLRAPLSNTRDRYPVLVFSHGLSFGRAGQNTVLVEELASRGYVVFAIDHPYDGLATVFPDGRVTLFEGDSYAANDPQPSQESIDLEARLSDSVDPIALLELARRTIRERPQESQMRRYWYEVWSQDQRFVLDQIERLQSGQVASPFAGRLRLDQIGVFGMSFGGVAAGRTCALDARCKAGINLDGFGDVSVENPPHRMPFMYFNNGTLSSNAVFLGIDRGARYFVKVRGAQHMDFSDAPLYSPLLKLMGASGSIDTRRMLALTNAYVTSFFGQHLLNEPAPLLAGPSPEYPEVEFLSRAATPNDENETAHRQPSTE